MDPIKTGEERSGLPVERKLISFGVTLPDEKTGQKGSLMISYRQYLVSPKGDEVSPELKTCFIKDMDPVFFRKGEVKTAAVYEEGRLVEDEELYEGDEIRFPGHSDFTEVEKNLVTPIYDVIRSELSRLDVDAPSYYELNNPTN